ncbi:histone-like nucleoid-structuring protein Lsr2 [Streptomyces sp. NPDC020800]|uniref:Lsr2 family DNA-binding protein n=1 Tax=Streptomyces sp. NPDC020800 TaxID=3365092 RepID=UPI0037A5F768
MTIAALRALLDEIDEQGGPEAARQDRLHLADESTENMTTDPDFVPEGPLLTWADEHSDPEVRDQASRARLALTGLRRRYEADRELTAITTEAERLEKRLAELRTREAELAPAKPKSKRNRKPVDYPAAEVRAWAKTNGIDCPPVGRVPKAVVEAWKAEKSKENTGGR